jgi:DUF971 family protein
MIGEAVLIRQIKQKDNHTFTIQWSDGKEHHFRLSTLQKQCPCANCIDEWSGKRVALDNSVDENVRAVSIKSIGRYALQIQFTSGCSTGIYSFDMLRKIAEENL